MPHDVRVIPARDFLRVDVENKLNLAESKKLLEEIAAAGAGKPDQNILVDLREAAGAPMLSSVDIFELVQTLRKLGLGILNKIAILRHPPHDFDRARFFEMLATDRGCQVGVFEDFETAFAWFYGHGEPIQAK